VFHLCESDCAAVTQARLKVVRTQTRRCALWDRKERSGSYSSRAVTTSGPIPRAQLPSRGIVLTAMPGVSVSCGSSGGWCAQWTAMPVVSVSCDSSGGWCVQWTAMQVVSVSCGSSGG
jgi:hypothetical protein